jgi:hypothetical protein
LIAQELEKILPFLINEGDSKSINYAGIIPYLINSIKELTIDLANLKLQILEMEKRDAK